VGVFAWLKAALSPAKLTTAQPVVRERPLYEQFTRIGGSLRPDQVSWIVRCADAGYPASLIDLGNESRQKDGHLQGILSARETAVAACPIDFVLPEPKGRPKGKRRGRKDQRAIDLCRRVVDEFDNWPTLVEHLTGAFFPGHATAETPWRKTKDGLLLPYKAEPIYPRHFVFSASNGALRYQPQEGIEVDLLAENPGRIVQIQRRIVGDVPCREGLIRLLTWAALFRNWTLTDWIALGETGWKPWRIGQYQKSASDEDIEVLEQALEEIGSTGVAVLPETTELKVEWPSGMAPGTGGSGTHRELFECIGREMSKAVLGTTTSVESGPNGTRSDTTTRDGLRLEKREQDAVAVAAALKAHLFSWVVKVNLGDDVLVPTPWFQTDESIDQHQFAQAVDKLASWMPIPAKWVRDEVGMPEPREGEEVLRKAPDGAGENGKPDGAEEDDGSEDQESGDDESDGESED
jgi:phage gp29-like protein